MGSYRIGAVNRLTGVPPETLRSWEMRYGLVAPNRTVGGFRVYSEEDLERIRLVRSLTLSGHAVGTLVGLDIEELGRLSDMDPSIAVDEAIRLVDNVIRILELDISIDAEADSDSRSIEENLLIVKEHLNNVRIAIN
tara:strand:- start:3059 stop:3469 length:411 start_codon:yes stop_codon:yes gene_type:complete